MSPITVKTVDLTAVATVMTTDGTPTDVILRFVIQGAENWYRHSVHGHIFRTAMGLFRLGTPDNIAAGFLRLGIKPSPKGVIYPTPHHLLQLESGKLIDLGVAGTRGAAHDLMRMLRDKKLADRIETAIMRNRSDSFPNPYL